LKLAQREAGPRGALRLAGLRWRRAKTEILSQLEHANLPKSGQMILFDGRTGEAFDQGRDGGHHVHAEAAPLVDEEGRSTRAASGRTRSSPSSRWAGKGAVRRAASGREWRCGAMEAYGAAYSLQEFLTVKSDDVVGRTRMYESIVKGEYALESGLPESFNVLIKELQSLGLDVELMETPAGAGGGPRTQERNGRGHEGHLQFLSRSRRNPPLVQRDPASRSPARRRDPAVVGHGEVKKPETIN